MVIGLGLKLIAYCRVSEETENIENQKYAIYQWASKLGYQVIDVFEDIGVSGALSPLERPGFKRAFEFINKNDVDGLVVYALDRIARSLTELVDVVRAIESRGKVVISVRETWIQQLDPRIRTLIVAILGWAGEMEREFIRERTREALRRVRAQGKRLGRPSKVNDSILKEAIKYVEKGYSLKDVSRILGIQYTTLCRHLTQSPTYRALYYQAKARVKARGR